MLLSAVSVLVVAQSSSEIPEGLMNNPVLGVLSTINMPRKRVNSLDAFCYIGGEVTFKFRRRSFTPPIKKCYHHYFGCKVGDQDKRWAPRFLLCDSARLLAAWAKGSRMPFPWFGDSPRAMFQIANSA